jgi:hypothetical protein
MGSIPDSIFKAGHYPNERNQTEENPPRFIWNASLAEHQMYHLQVINEQSPSIYEVFIKYPFHTPSRNFEPGEYRWRWRKVKVGEDNGDWVDCGVFSIPDELPITPLSSLEERQRIMESLSRPRMWLNPNEIIAFRNKVDSHEEVYGWKLFIEQSVIPWMSRDLLNEPLPYPDGKRTVSLWRESYIVCQEVFYAIRHLAVGGVISQRSDWINRAKKWLLETCRWSQEGTTSCTYNNESAFRIARALAWGYDWLYDYLSHDEREFVRKVLFCRTSQIACFVLEEARIHENPYHSHGVRALSSVLFPCCLALLGDGASEEEALIQEWMNYSIEYLATLFPPWGGADGGWAEGPMYWTTGLASVTEALLLMRKALQIDLFQRPFFQRTGDFPLYCYSPDTTRASFGDQSSLGERPGLKTGMNMRLLAGITGNKRYRWYYDRTIENDPKAQESFTNYGWWDFRFDEMMIKHDFPDVKAETPNDLEPIKCFYDIGWVAFHHQAGLPNDHIMLLTKSSPFGSVSHSHGDQGAFLLHAFGEPLAVHSGYGHNGCGTTMHKNWRKQTRAHNALLIDGKGQYAGDDDRLCLEAKGRIVNIFNSSRIQAALLDTTDAYRYELPYVQKVNRMIIWVDYCYFVIVDELSLTQEGNFEWLLHSLHRFHIQGNTASMTGDKAELYVEWTYSSGTDPLMVSQQNEFLEVEPKEWEGLDAQWHLSAKSGTAKEHRLVSLVVPSLLGKRVDIQSGITSEGITWTIKNASFCLPWNTSDEFMNQLHNNRRIQV